MFRSMMWMSVLAVLACAGCSESTGVKTVRVSGVVQLDGKPLVDTEVHFIGPKHAGFGKTDSAGKFKLVTGAEPGENKVFFRKSTDDKFANPDEGLDAGQADAATAAQSGAKAAKVEKGIPEEYSGSATTKLSFTVPEGGSDSANFELDSPK